MTLTLRGSVHNRILNDVNNVHDKTSPKSNNWIREKSDRAEENKTEQLSDVAIPPLRRRTTTRSNSDRKSHNKGSCGVIKRRQINRTRSESTDLLLLESIEFEIEESNRKVCFNPSLKICDGKKVPTFDPSDIWWSQNEIHEFQINQIDMKFESEAMKRKLNQYNIIYNEAREQINNSCRLPGPVMDRFVNCVKYGFSGMEVYGPNKRQYSNRRKDIVRKIVTVHQVSVKNQLKKSQTQRFIASLAQSLTACDRHWAIVVGKAQMLAISKT